VTPPVGSPLAARSSSAQERRSAASLTSAAGADGEDDVDRLVANQRERRSASQSPQSPALGSRSNSLASVCSAGEARYGTVAVRGDIELALQYRQTQNLLELCVRQCRHLAAADTRRSKSDPYVKVYLLPDRSKTGKRKTKIKKNTLNPVFDEPLRFPAAVSELDSRTLWVTVWHSDMFGRNDFLGEVLLPLNALSLESEQARWYPLQERSDLHEEGGGGPRGDVIVALKYAPPEDAMSRRSRRPRGTLHVMIKEAKHLVSARSNGSADPFCKCYLLPDRKGSKQKTSVVRRSLSPRWSGALSFPDVTAGELAERALELTVWDHSLTANELLGAARFNSTAALHQGRPVDWMDAAGQEVTLWEQMLERPGFWVEGSVPLRATLDRPQ